MKLEAKFIRIGNIIHNASDRSVHETHKSIGAAKRWSRQFQSSNGGLGCGSLVVEPTQEQKRHAARVKQEREDAEKRAQQRLADQKALSLQRSQQKQNADVRPGSKTSPRSIALPQASRFLNTHGADIDSSSSRAKSGRRRTGHGVTV